MKVEEAQSDADIRRCFPVIQVLRPHIASADDFLDMYKRMVEWYDSKLKKPGIKATSDK